MPRITANGLTFHVQRSGAGPDVVLIHGVTGDLSIWFLCRAMQVLAEESRVTAYDLRGHGYSDVPASGYTSARSRPRPGRPLDVLEIDRARLVGHSFGAVIAVHAAVIAPERVEALILSDPYFPALRHLEDLSRWGHWQNFRQEAEEAGVYLSSDTWYDLTTFFDQVLHLDDDRLLGSARRWGCLAGGESSGSPRPPAATIPRLIAGLSTELISEHFPALPGTLRRGFAVSLNGRLPDRDLAGLSGAADPRGEAPRPRGEPGGLRRGGARVPRIDPLREDSRGLPMSEQPHVLITGAANGIGRATALELARENVPVSMIDIDAKSLGEGGRGALRGRCDGSPPRSRTSPSGSP